MTAILTTLHRPVVASTLTDQVALGIAGTLRAARVASSQKLAPMTAGWHAGRCEALLDLLLPLVRSDDDMAAITSARARVRALLMGEQS